MCEERIVCDNCQLFTDYIAVKIDFGYPSSRDGELKCFCSDKCFKEFVEIEVIP